MIKKIVHQIQDRRINAWIVFYILIYVVFIVKYVTLRTFDNSIFFATYSIAVSAYIISRFAIAHFYHIDSQHFSDKYQPTICFGVPAKNEGSGVYETIMKIAASGYPADKLTIIAINDGSDDDTYGWMKKAAVAARKIGVKTTLLNWKQNRGKREAMASCIRMTKSEIIIFVDSDSIVAADAARQLAKYFISPAVGAVSAHGYVANKDVNLITKMQDVRYFVAFKAYKASEALFGNVTCCSGCCSAYRVEYVRKILPQWVNQKFLGVACTYGDDRSLTNYLLQGGHQTLYASEALVYTHVPESFTQFMRQQLRWKKSWIRESIKAAKFMWRKNIVMSVSFYLGLILPLLAPIIVFRAIVWYPITTNHAPWYYLLGLMLMAMVYGLYYFIFIRDRRWVYGVIFASFYTLVLIWQLPWAILNLRDSRWGTR